MKLSSQCVPQSSQIIQAASVENDEGTALRRTQEIYLQSNRKITEAHSQEPRKAFNSAQDGRPFAVGGVGLPRGKVFSFEVFGAGVASMVGGA